MARGSSRRQLGDATVAEKGFLLELSRETSDAESCFPGKTSFLYFRSSRVDLEDSRGTISLLIRQLMREDPEKRPRALKAMQTPKNTEEPSQLFFPDCI